MAKTTRATLALQKAGVPFAASSYVYDPDADRIGLQAAEAPVSSSSSIRPTCVPPWTHGSQSWSCGKADR